MLRTLILLGLLALPASAQLQLFQFDGSKETPLGSVYQAAATAVGDTLELRFHVYNSGAGPATLQTLSIAGQDFRLSSVPSAGYIIAPSLFVEFRVAFTPTGTGSYSAILLVNSIAVLLRANAVTAATVSLGSTVLAAGAIIDFGGILRATSTTQTLTLSNPGASGILIGSIVVTGDSFQGPLKISAPLNLAAGQSVNFQVVFAPSAAGNAKGTLTIDQRSFGLSGIGLEPALPSAAIAVVSLNQSSAQQATVGVQLASASQISATATLTMEFQSSVPGAANDSAVQFLSGPPRAATVTFAPGESIGRFNGAPQLTFQTGTTAGTITFKLQLPNGLQQTTITVAPALIHFDLASGTERTSDLDVNLTGFDNTHSASQISFTFYWKSGQMLQSPIQLDLTKNFQTYFGSVQGGAFAFRATFPVSGDITQIGGVDVTLTNSVGAAKTQRITF